jgi:hypothetical protein
MVEQEVLQIRIDVYFVSQNVLHLYDLVPCKWANPQLLVYLPPAVMLHWTSSL